VDSQPQRLDATILANERHIVQDRETLGLCSGIETYLYDLPPAQQPSMYRRSCQNEWMRRTVWEAAEPPGGLVALHERRLGLAKLYRYLTGEKWTYCGNLDDTHLTDVDRGRADAARKR